MNWQTKAAIQRVISRLPFSETLYYGMQRYCGGLRQPDDVVQLAREAADIFLEIERAGVPIRGANVFEVGTGHRVNMPLMFYLAGASSVTTCDLYCILRPSLVMRSVHEISRRRGDLIGALASLQIDTDGLVSRIERLAAAPDFDAICRTMRLKYLAPFDAADTKLPSGTFDIHFSFTVMEHIPAPVLVNILREGTRLVAPHGNRGVLAHLIDLSDHFSHGNPAISPVNFLQFSQTEWHRLAGNRWAYHNRLREQHFREAYRQAGQDVIAWNAGIDKRAVSAIENGLPLAPEFRDMGVYTLAATTILAISR